MPPTHPGDSQPDFFGIMKVTIVPSKSFFCGRLWHWGGMPLESPRFPLYNMSMCRSIFQRCTPQLPTTSGGTYFSWFFSKDPLCWGPYIGWGKAAPSTHLAGGKYLGWYEFVATKSLSYLKHWRELYPSIGFQGGQTAVDPEHIKKLAEVDVFLFIWWCGCVSVCFLTCFFDFEMGYTRFYLDFTRILINRTTSIRWRLVIWKMCFLFFLEDVRSLGLVSISL